MGCFSGVRAFLAGFDDEQVIEEDPACAAAKKDGKILVNTFWLDDCLEASECLKPVKGLHTPSKHPGKVPGAAKLLICLTGYQGAARRNVKLMVDKLGARFSKPLAAGQVTHLVCFTHEGDKYNLARKTNIKVVNERWLQDRQASELAGAVGHLEAWCLEPEDLYGKSGAEVEAEERRQEEDLSKRLAAQGHELGCERGTGAFGDVPAAVPDGAAAQRPLQATDDVRTPPQPDEGIGALEEASEETEVPDLLADQAGADPVPGTLIADRKVDGGDRASCPATLQATSVAVGAGGDGRALAPGAKTVELPGIVGSLHEWEAEGQAAGNKAHAEAGLEVAARAGGGAGAGAGLEDARLGEGEPGKVEKGSSSGDGNTPSSEQLREVQAGVAAAVDVGGLTPSDLQEGGSPPPQGAASAVLDSLAVAAERQGGAGRGSSGTSKRAGLRAPGSLAAGESSKATMVAAAAAVGGGEAASIVSIEEKVLVHVSTEMEVGVALKSSPKGTVAAASVAATRNVRRRKYQAAGSSQEESAGDGDGDGDGDAVAGGAPKQASAELVKGAASRPASNAGSSPAVLTRAAASAAVSAAKDEPPAGQSTGRRRAQPSGGRSTGRPSSRRKQGASEDPGGMEQLLSPGALFADTATPAQTGAAVEAGATLAVASSAETVVQKSKGGGIAKEPLETEEGEHGASEAPVSTPVDPLLQADLKGEGKEGEARAEWRARPMQSLSRAHHSWASPREDDSEVSPPRWHHAPRSTSGAEAEVEALVLPGSAGQAEQEAEPMDVGVQQRGQAGKRGRSSVPSGAAKAGRSGAAASKGSRPSPLEVGASRPAARGRGSRAGSGAGAEAGTGAGAGAKKAKEKAGPAALVDEPEAGKSGRRGRGRAAASKKRPAKGGELKVEEDGGSAGEKDAPATTAAASTKEAEGLGDGKAAAAAAAADDDRGQNTNTNTTDCYFTAQDSVRSEAAKGEARPGGCGQGAPGGEQGAAPSGDDGARGHSSRGEPLGNGEGEAAAGEPGHTMPEDSPEFATAPGEASGGAWPGVGAGAGAGSGAEDGAENGSGAGGGEGAEEADGVGDKEGLDEGRGVAGSVPGLKGSAPAKAWRKVMASKDRSGTSASASRARKKAKAAEPEPEPELKPKTKPKPERPAQSPAKHGKGKGEGEGERNGEGGEEGEGDGKKVKCFAMGGDSKESYRAMIKRLGGRLAGEHHQWKNNATHVILPEPLRRTEKFFAGAAAGRWLLKPSYLEVSVCEEHFVAEEDYEWQGEGENEDGTVQLDAPRKWRLHFESTGCGAFEGLAVVFYGASFTPTLDTFKRVIVAGGGKVQRTSPPFKSALKSGLDFAVIASGMPRDDPWIQEFVEAQVACVTAEYLVNLVAKPGAPLDAHVLYGTHAAAEAAWQRLEATWAEGAAERSEKRVRSASHSDLGRRKAVKRSLGSGGKQKPAREAGKKRAKPRPVGVVEESEELGGGGGGGGGGPRGEDGEGSEDGVVCEACRRADMEDVMLLCGDDEGQGCGRALHIQCMEPPLDRVPDEDWFCEYCSLQCD
eukprot:jgi/Mesen1/1286/ME000013S00791